MLLLCIIKLYRKSNSPWVLHLQPNHIHSFIMIVMCYWMFTKPLIRSTTIALPYNPSSPTRTFCTSRCMWDEANSPRSICPMLSQWDIAATSIWWAALDLSRSNLRLPWRQVDQLVSIPWGSSGACTSLRNHFQSGWGALNCYKCDIETLGLLKHPCQSSRVYMQLITPKSLTIFSIVTLLESHSSTIQYPKLAMKLVLFANRLWILHKDNATGAWHWRSWQLVAGMSTSCDRCGRCTCLYTLFIMISYCTLYDIYHDIMYYYIDDRWYIWAGVPLHQRSESIQSSHHIETSKRVSHMDLQHQIGLKDTILANQVHINKTMTRINGDKCQESSKMFKALERW